MKRRIERVSDELGSGLRLSSKHIKLIKADLQVAHCLKLEYSNGQFFHTALTTTRLNSQHRSPDGMSSRLRPFGCVDNPEKPYVGK